MRFFHYPPVTPEDWLEEARWLDWCGHKEDALRILMRLARAIPDGPEPKEKKD